MKTLLALLAFSTLTLAATAKVTETFSQTYPLSATGTIRLENANGSVEIIAWDKNEVALEAEKNARDAEGLARLTLKIESTPERLAIKTVYTRKWKLFENANAHVRYKLMVPAGVTLDKIDVVNATIRVTGIKGSVNLDTVNGNIDAKDLAGAGIFDTVNGSINVAYATLPAGEISLDTVNGSCKVTLPAQAAFRVDADTVNGRTHCEFPITLEKSGKHDLRGTVNGGGSTLVKLDSVNGSLTIAQAK